MIWAQVLIVAYSLTLIGMRSRILVLLLALLTLAPVQGVSLAMALRGLWGDPSITTLQLLVLAFAGKTPPALRHGYRMPLCIALLAAALYASALGSWNLDLYRFGYQPAELVTVFGAIALIAWRRGNPLWLSLLSIDLLAWHGGWLESSNLWDYLLDPLLALVMLVLAIRNSRRRHLVDTISQNTKWK